jgi:long-chain acyl-CoA synthetase
MTLHFESAYAVMTPGAYAVPINWHFKSDEIAYVVKDSGARVLIGHADLLHGLPVSFPQASPCSA